MAGLTANEKQAGRLFKEAQLSRLSYLNQTEPPTYTVPPFLAVYRHLCPARNNQSTAMELKERYVTSLKFAEWGVPAGRFAFLYREGRCSNCGQTARSGVGRIVDANTRPPLSGRGTRS